MLLNVPLFSTATVIRTMMRERPGTIQVLNGNRTASDNVGGYRCVQQGTRTFYRTFFLSADGANTVCTMAYIRYFNDNCEKSAVSDKGVAIVLREDD